MLVPTVTRKHEAVSFTTTPTDRMTFLCPGGPELPDVTDERLSPGDGPPFHKHPWATWEVVVEGSILAVVDGTESVLNEGDMLFTPPDVPHAFMALGTSPSRLVGVNWPGGFHELYAKLAQLFPPDSGEPDFGRFAALASEHGAEILGPPLRVTHANHLV